jgi:hypothetical protein
MTYAPRGSKQVGLIGNEEKRAFTVLLGVSAAGHRVPIQCVYEGKTEQSTPTETASSRRECDDAKFCFAFSGKTANHWSNQKTMRELVEDVLIPFLNMWKERLGVPLSQRALVILDVWSVH